MTKSSTLTLAILKTEITADQKHQRVVDWLDEVHVALYKHLDLSGNIRVCL